MQKYVLLMFLITLLITSCSTTGESVTNPVYAAEEETTLADSNNTFAFNLLPLLTENGNGNVFFSPYSISSAIGMLYNGAENTSKADIGQVFHWDLLTDEEFNKGQKYLYQALNSRENITIMTGNSIWINDKKYISINEDYLLENKEVFDAKSETLDLTHQEGINTINQWIANQTNNKITQVLSQPYTEDNPMLLVNAIYFFGGWMHEFSESETRSDTFYGTSGDKDVQMMHQRERFAYMKTDEYELAVLPYKELEAKMMILLPTEDSFDDFVHTMNYETYTNITSTSLKNEDVILTLPKFSLEYGVESLSQTLIELGMPTAFNASEADFSGISDDALDYQLRISDVLHKALIDVDEKGTEAAAVTVAEMETTSAEPTEPIRFTVDRPFVFFIVDQKTDVLLFVGVVRNID